MPPKKGGLGQQAASPEKSEDLLDAVFGGNTGQQDTPPPATGKRAGKAAGKDKDERVALYVKIDRELSVKLRVYAAQNELKVHEVMDLALRKLFADEAD